MAYGDKRDYPKIHIFVRPTASQRKEGSQGKYLATTTWAKTCKEACERYAGNGNDYTPSDLVAHRAGR